MITCLYTTNKYIQKTNKEISNHIEIYLSIVLTGYHNHILIFKVLNK